MYLDRPKKNSFTIGKQLRKNKALRKKDPKAEVIPLNAELKAYKEDLERQGLKVGPIEVALFQTNNGLKYPGFVAKEKIVSNSILLRVPVDCLLTTRDAYMSQIQKVFEENPKFYAKQFSSDWQDRIILTYLLFEHQKGKKSKWYHLLTNLPRDIDYVAFWPQNELKHLEDQWVRHSIVKQKARVLAEQQELIEIAKKYPQYFDMAVFTSQNITWIHVHLVTRCFGKYFEYTTMVPYAQLFNHQCVDVYYTMTYKEDNPYNPNQQLQQPRQLTQQEEDEADTSEGSYNASDVACSDEDFQERQIQEEEKPKYQSVASEFKSEHSYLCAFINFNDEVSLFYLEKIYMAMEEALNMPQSEGLARMVKVHSKNVRYLKLVKQFFFKIGSNRYSYGLRQKKIWREKQKTKQEPVFDPNADYFGGKWAKDKFDDFIMICGSKDQFEPGSQVYFCYGRLPNRLLLMRYGIALEHNKYNHLYIRINISEHVYKCKALQRAVQADIALRKYKRFKIKRTAFCIELATFYRGMLWNVDEDPESIFGVYHLERELQVMKMVKRTLEQTLDQFSCSIEQNQQKLKDKQVGYHEYFAIVYKIQRQRILIQQIKMVNYAVQLLLQIDKGQVLEKMLRNQKDQSRLRFQVMMEVYLRSIRLF